MTAERSEVQFGGTAIPYRIRRSRRVKTVAVSVDRATGVLLTAPEGVLVTRLDAIVHSKAGWILSKLKRTSDLPPPPAREFVSGETFTYLGRQYRLRVLKGREPGCHVSLRKGWFEVEVPKLAEPERTAQLRASLVDWLRQHAAERLPERVEQWAVKLGLPLPEVLIREQEKRWGSCDAKGRLRFNWRIIQAPMRLVDYVVAHELTHLVHRGHTPQFWRLLGKVMPDYEERRRMLAELGAGVEW